MRSQVKNDKACGETAHASFVAALAPVDMRTNQPDGVAHSLAVLATVYHYNHWVFDLIRDSLGDAVLEVGAGIGNITQFMLNVNRLTCLEPSECYRHYLTGRFANHLNVTVLPHRIEECPNDAVGKQAFDTIVCLNVLEHIEDDVAVLKRFVRLLRPGGRVAILVPAMPVLYGAMDQSMGHWRRYTLGSLRRAFAEAGLRPRQGHYVNCVGAAGWWWRGRVQGKTTIPEGSTRFFDRLVPLLSSVERIISPPLGQSIVMIGEPLQ